MAAAIQTPLELAFLDKLLKAVVGRNVSATRFKTKPKQLDKTLKSIEPKFYDSSTLNQVLDCPKRYSRNKVVRTDHLIELALRSFSPIRKEEVDGYSDALYVTLDVVLKEFAIHPSSKEPVAKKIRLFIEVQRNKFSIWCIEQIAQPMSTQILSLSTDETFASNWYDLIAPKVEVLALNIHSNKHTLPQFIEKMDLPLKVLCVTTSYNLYPSPLQSCKLLVPRIKLIWHRYPSIEIVYHQSCSIENLPKQPSVERVYRWIQTNHATSKLYNSNINLVEDDDGVESLMENIHIDFSLDSPPSLCDVALQCGSSTASEYNGAQHGTNTCYNTFYAKSEEALSIGSVVLERQDSQSYGSDFSHDSLPSYSDVATQCGSTAIEYNGSQNGTNSEKAPSIGCVVLERQNSQSCGSDFSCNSLPSFSDVATRCASTAIEYNGAHKARPNGVFSRSFSHSNILNPQSTTRRREREREKWVPWQLSIKKGN